MEHENEQVLVIKLGAFGDFIHAFHAFAAIRAHHPRACITLLTTAPFAALAQASPWFNRVLSDTRPAWWNLVGLRRLARVLHGFDRVYDLQTSRRSGRYFRLAGRPPWSGIARGCAFPHANPERNRMHTLERQREQLAMAGITEFPPPPRVWMASRGTRHGVTAPYALLVPGDSKGEGSPKRWPADRFGALAVLLASRGVTPVVIGGAAEAGLAAAIRQVCPAGVDLTGRTTVFDIAALGAGAAVVVGNDTGPLHLACAAGAPTVALFGGASAKSEAAPRGPAGEWATTLTAPLVASLTVEAVAAAVAAVLDRSAAGGVGQRQAKAEQKKEPAADR